jgi:hypothetical protein
MKNQIEEENKVYKKPNIIEEKDLGRKTVVVSKSRIRLSNAGNEFNEHNHEKVIIKMIFFENIYFLFLENRYYDKYKRRR